MVLWIVLAVIVFALLLLALAVRPVLVALPRLHRAVGRLRQRQVEAEALRDSALVLQQRLEGLAADAGEAQRRIAVIKTAVGK
ncbi:hypothetical protein [Plantactinospora sp. KBS50]|uniref:hypothetical protein n=1 Tax=Plantactinospora sp. KBS50 TaxID=2024580 RepID=UPI000BAABAAF|nr:hypothetical protein [Plantactinospora sp. KBS50]ASW55065.1 hypothetical protein CIK06_14065 [Plantactinospora sp. KBS50]